MVRVGPPLSWTGLAACSAVAVEHTVIEGQIAVGVEMLPPATPPTTLLLRTTQGEGALIEDAFALRVGTILSVGAGRCEDQPSRIGARCRQGS